MSGAVPEAGMPIVRETMCKAGAHVYTHTGSEPVEWQRCDCGLLKWNPNTKRMEKT